MAGQKTFVSVNLTPEARDRLRVASLKISLALERKVSMADALLILNEVAQQHQDEITATALRLLDGEGGTDHE